MKHRTENYVNGLILDAANGLGAAIIKLIYRACLSFHLIDIGTSFEYMVIDNT
jgi:hypothetical protein